MGMDSLHCHQDRRLLLTSVLLCSLILYGVTTVNMRVVDNPESPDATSSSMSSYTISSKNSSNPNTKKPSVSPTSSPIIQEEKEDINILCFGDSLTAGVIKMGRNRQFAPYAPHLETFLKEKLIPHEPNDGGAFGRDVHVNHTGLPGWTSYKLHHEILEETLAKFKREDGSSSSLDMIIIMAGTNDLFQQKYLKYNISESVISMHQLALDEDYKVPLTIALDIPMSAMFTGNDVVLQEMKALSRGLRKFSNSESRTTYVPFPFGLDDVEYWNGDGIHCNTDGYKKLAKSLAPIVEKSLQDAGLW